MYYNKKLSCRREAARCFVFVCSQLQHTYSAVFLIPVTAVSDLLVHKILLWLSYLAFGRYGAFSVSAVYLQQFSSYSNHNCKISPFLRTPAFIFVCPGDAPVAITQNVAWMKRIQCLPNPSQHVPSIFNSFPVIRTASAKNRRFHVPQPTLLFPLETPLWLSRNMLHGWKDNSMLAIPLQHIPIYLQ